ncbi:MAG: metal ABC transporter permease [Armatimonadota bacterium]
MDIFAYSYMQRALIAGVLIGGLCAIIGVYVVLKGLSFIGAGISHASFGGIAVGAALGVNPVWTAVVFCLAVGWGIGFVSRRGRVKEDTAVGVFFASTMALGVLIIGLIHGYQVDLMSYLFGSIISVSRADLWTMLVMAAVVLGLVTIFYKDLMFVAFDAEMAEVTGVPAEKLYLLLVSLISLVVVMSIKVVGIVLVSALVVTPAAAAFQLTESFHKMIALSAAFGIGACLVGLVIADLVGIAPGATIVLLATLAFFLSAAFSPKRSRKARE